MASCLGQTVCNTPTSGDRRPDKTVVRVGTFNLAWLFDGVNDPSGSVWATPTDAQMHIQKVAQQILRTNVDILAVHEVESCDVLASLVSQLGPTYKAYLVPGTDTATGQNCALITRVDPSSPLERTSNRASYPVSGSTCGSTTTGDSGVSKHARTSFTLSRLKFDLVMAHFKSGGTTSDCLQREAQAKVLLDTYINSATGRSIIMVGDLNDWDATYTDALGNKGTSQTLPLLKSGAGGLASAGVMLPVANRTSSGVGMIDHVLMSNDLAQASTWLQTSVDGSPYPTTSSAKLAAYYSDHLPVVVTFRDALSSASILSYSFILLLLLLFYINI